MAPYFDTAMDAFGPKRLLFGSDLPVLLLAGQYKPWVEIVKKAISRYSKDEQEQILYKNAKDAYGVWRLRGFHIRLQALPLPRPCYSDSN